MAGFLFDSLYGGLQNVLDLRQQQQAIRPRTWRTKTRRASKRNTSILRKHSKNAIYGESPVAMKTTDRRHMNTGTVQNPDVEEVEAAPWSLDGNSVNTEKEMARLHSNNLFYQAVTKGVTKRLAMLKYAANNGK